MKIYGQILHNQMDVHSEVHVHKPIIPGVSSAKKPLYLPGSMFLWFYISRYLCS